MMACKELGRKVDVLAINHWNIAIATHMTNHPGFRHMCENLDSVNPKKAIPGGKLDILLAGPECTHHSNARGGKPMLDQSRASAWHVVRWCEALYVQDVVVENVMEFQKWGPLDRKGRRIKEREGETFKAWIAALESLDYRVEWKVLNAADFGDATTRKRLFIRARRGDKAISWPDPSNNAASWRPARDVIDWSIPGQSIFDRKKPLAPATMARIMVGLKKFGGEKIEPFLIVFRNHQDASDIDQPIPTMTTSGANFGLCEPFVLGQQSGSVARSVQNPFPTIATGGAIALIEPFLVEYHGSHKEKKDGDGRTMSVQRPFKTLDTSNRFGLCEPFMVKYYRTGTAYPVSKPMDTITAKDRIGLVVPEINGVALDIRFRMLQPHELAEAMGFPKTYKFAGTREAKVRQIGNAWSVRTAKALCKSVLQ
jgi:DNA (cytosine-5)-methyltransferase 1